MLHTVNDELLVLKEVSRTFRSGTTEVRALRDISVRVHPGELLGIIGPSGSGKTTLLNIIGGLDRPDSGQVLFRGKDIRLFNDKELTLYRRANIGFVFQFFNLVATLTALENVELAAELVKTPLDPQEVLRLVGMAERMHHFPSQLSGGEQQRVAIARAIVKNPPLLLCDEPTGALDYETAKHVLSFIERLPAAYGTTVLIVTHNQAIAAMCTRVIRLRSGEIVEERVNPAPVPASTLVW